MSTYKVGGKVYFNNYSPDREVAEKTLRPGSSATILSESEIDGQKAFEIEDKKGNKCVVLESELKASGRMNTKTAEAAVNKENNPEQQKQSAIEKAEEKDVEKFLTTADGRKTYTFISDEVLEQEYKEHAEDPLVLARQYWDGAQRSYFRLGGVLANIYFNKDYKTKYNYVNAGGFNQFIDEQFPKISSRTARYYMKIYVWMTNLEIPEQEVIDLGWTIAAEIANVAAAGASKEEVLDLIAFAKANTGTALIERIRRQYPTGKETIKTETETETPAEVSVMKSVTFQVFEDQLPIIEQVVNHIKQVYPETGETLGQQLMVAFTEYLANIKSEQGAIDQPSYIQYGEAAFDNSEVFIRNKSTGEVFSLHHDSSRIKIDVADVPKETQEQQLEAVAG